MACKCDRSCLSEVLLSSEVVFFSSDTVLSNELLLPLSSGEASSDVISCDVTSSFGSSSMVIFFRVLITCEWVRGGERGREGGREEGRRERGREGGREEGGREGAKVGEREGGKE